MSKESFVLQSLFGTSPCITRESRFFDSIAESSKEFPTISPSPTLRLVCERSIEGEMLRFKKSTKELNISRWCVLDSQSFKYYKSQYSAMCEEKPIFVLPISNITGAKAVSNGREHIIEIFSSEGDFTTSPLSTKLSIRSSVTVSEKHLLSKPRHFEPRPAKFTKANVAALIPSPLKTIKKSLTTLRENKNSWTSRENVMYLTEERLIFLVSSKEEWEKWKHAFKTIAKAEIFNE